MKLPDIYRDWRIVTGLALALLGAGNWIVGLQKAQESNRMIAQAARVLPSNDYRGFDELEAGAGGEVLEPFTTAQARVSYARARMDFYHVTFLTGQVMLIAGLVTMLLGFISLIQREARRVLRRLSEHPNEYRTATGRR